MQTQSESRWCPHVTVATIVVRDNRYLLVKENQDGKTVINQPAGHVEKNEPLNQAVIRETLEETGWQVEPKFLVGIHHYTTPQDATYLRFTFFSDAITHHPNQPLDKVIEEVVWMTKEQLMAAAMLWRGPVVMQCIDDFEQGQNFPLSVIKEQ